MKVLKRKEWGFKFVCAGCGSHLEAAKNDVKKRRWADYSGDSGVDNIVSCPVCGRDRELKYSELPPNFY